MYRPLLTTALLCAMLPACASWRALDRADVQGDDFLSVLALEYRQFAKAEAEQYDWFDANYFGKKGLKITKGAYQEPEMPDDWDVGEQGLQELQAERERLMKYVTDGNKLAVPLELARAQMLFDCWVEQQEEQWQEDDIATCKDSYFTAMAQLQQALSGHKKITSAVVTQAKPAAMETELFGSHLVYFDYDRASITQSARATIEGIADFVMNMRQSVIELVGHTDSSGQSSYNDTLAGLRAQAVQVELMKRGVKKERLNITASGEKSLAVPTSDSKNEPANRRVEIIVRPEGEME